MRPILRDARLRRAPQDEVVIRGAMPVRRVGKAKRAHRSFDADRRWARRDAPLLTLQTMDPNSITGSQDEVVTSGSMPDPHGEEAHRTVSNHEARQERGKSMQTSLA